MSPKTPWQRRPGRPLAKRLRFWIAVAIPPRRVDPTTSPPRRQPGRVMRLRGGGNRVRRRRGSGIAPASTRGRRRCRPSAKPPWRTGPASVIGRPWRPLASLFPCRSWSDPTTASPRRQPRRRPPTWWQRDVKSRAVARLLSLCRLASISQTNGSADRRRDASGAASTTWLDSGGRPWPCPWSDAVRRGFVGWRCSWSDPTTTTPRAQARGEAMKLRRRGSGGPPRWIRWPGTNPCERNDAGHIVLGSPRRSRLRRLASFDREALPCRRVPPGYDDDAILQRHRPGRQPGAGDGATNRQDGDSSGLFTRDPATAPPRRQPDWPADPQGRSRRWPS